MSSARMLLRLQEIDLDAESTRKSIVELKERLGQSSELVQARETLEQAESRVRQKEKTLQEEELELQKSIAKLDESRSRLYSGTVSNPKELAGLEKEVKHLTQRRGELEEKVLLSMIAIEEGRKASDTARSQYELIQSRWASEQKQIEEELEQLRIHASKLARARSDLEMALDPKDLELYADLRRRKGSTPVARLRGETCQSCGVNLPVAVARQVRNEQDLVLCPSCGRLLIAE